MMICEVGLTGAIVQARCTAAAELVDGYMPGQTGYVAFRTSLDGNVVWQSAAVQADPRSDYIVRAQMSGLEPGTSYRVETLIGMAPDMLERAAESRFSTLRGARSTRPVHMALTSCLHYSKFAFERAATGTPQSLAELQEGYPALATISRSRPDCAVLNGDLVYYDAPLPRQLEQFDARAVVNALGYIDAAALERHGARTKWHRQFAQRAMRSMLADVPVYILKDDHDYRANDADPYSSAAITARLGARLSREQVAIGGLEEDGEPKPYRTRRMSRDLEVWFLEGRDYRDANDTPDGPDKTLWGQTQYEWIQRTLAASDATFKVIVSPTPLIGPDDAYKTDNHVNHRGFRHEGQAFLNWLAENFAPDEVQIVTGDRHWQYHSIDQRGINEYSSGTLVDQNARSGRIPGDPAGTDPDSEISQPYCQHADRDGIGGGFIDLRCERAGDTAMLKVSFRDIYGAARYEVSTSRNF